MSKCKDCFYSASDDGFMECRWGWDNTEEAVKFLIENNRPANGYDLALEMGKFRFCTKFKKKRNYLMDLFRKSAE